MVIDSFGKVGIGNSSPGSQFHVVTSTDSSAGLFEIGTSLSNFTTGLGAINTGTGSGDKAGAIFNNAGTGGDTHFGLLSQASGGSVVNIGAQSTASGGTTNSNIGVFAAADSGMEAYGVFADAFGISGGTAFGILASATGADTNYAAFFNDGDVRVENNLGIGKYPTSKLDVSGKIKTDSIQILASGGSDGYWLRRDAAGNAYWDTLSAPSSLSWSLTGNTGTSASTNFLGTIDATDLVFRTSNTERMRIQNTGNVGIGDSSPSAKLSVAGAIQVDTVQTLTPVAGMIQWNGTDFEGYTGSDWVSFTTDTANDCPTGTVAVNNNFCIETAERSAATWFDAVEVCATANRKLPTWGEWYAASQLVSITNMTDADWEWVDDGTSNTARKVGNSSATANANDDPSSSSNTYRCIYMRK